MTRQLRWIDGAAEPPPEGKPIWIKFKGGGTCDPPEFAALGFSTYAPWNFLWALDEIPEFLPPEEQPLPYKGVTATIEGCEDPSCGGWMVHTNNAGCFPLFVRASTKSEAIRLWNICVRAIEAVKEPQ